jgi:hypothetical protein
MYYFSRKYCMRLSISSQYPCYMDRYILYFKKDSKAYVDLDKISPKLINWTDFNEIVG